MRDWFRCTDWNEATEGEFFRRLKRARRQRPQYLVIQAATLVGTGRRELAACALSLLELFTQEYYAVLREPGIQYQGPGTAATGTLGRGL
jgi:hypothetical protein